MRNVISFEMADICRLLKSELFRPGFSAQQDALSVKVDLDKGSIESSNDKLFANGFVEQNPSSDQESGQDNQVKLKYKGAMRPVYI